jgi:hypothetical protein
MHQDAGYDKPRSKSCMKCPLWKKPLKQVCHTCEFYEHLKGYNPNDGELMDKWACTLKFGMLLQLENNKFTFELGSAMEDLRNQTVELQRIGLHLAVHGDEEAEHALSQTLKLIDAKIGAMRVARQARLKPSDSAMLDPRRILENHDGYEAPQIPAPTEPPAPRTIADYDGAGPQLEDVCETDEAVPAKRPVRGNPKGVRDNKGVGRGSGRKQGSKSKRS